MGAGWTVAAVQASYVLMDREATTSKVEQLIADAADLGARLIVFPEVFIPGTPLWIDTVPIWDNDEAWYARLVDQAVVVPSPTTERIGAAAREAGAYVVIGVNECQPHGATIYNTLLYFGPDGQLLGTHRKLVPTGSERTVWGMGDGSTLEVVPTELGRIGGLICWENYMPLARFHLYAQGIDVWLAPTLARGDGWVATCATSPAKDASGSSGATLACGSPTSQPTFPTGTVSPASWTPRTGTGSNPATRSSAIRAVSSWPDRSATARAFSLPRSISPRCTLHAGCSIRPATITGPTSSISPSTPGPVPQSLS